MLDEYFFFEDAEDARWFWREGFRQRLYVDVSGASISCDEMALWIDGGEIDYRGEPLP